MRFGREKAAAEMRSITHHNLNGRPTKFCEQTFLLTDYFDGVSILGQGSGTSSRT